MRDNIIDDICENQNEKTIRKYVLLKKKIVECGINLQMFASKLLSCKKFKKIAYFL